MPSVVVIVVLATYNFCMSKHTQNDDLFIRADWYDRSINWNARLKRELPVLMDVLGEPGEGGLVDAGCGTAHQAIELANMGYRVTGLDASEAMLEVARKNATSCTGEIKFVCEKYDSMFETLGGGFDGIFSQANALAAAGSREGVASAINNFAKCLRSGGRLFVQILNFAPMRLEIPCVRGPRVTNVDSQEYISIRQFHFDDKLVRVSNVTVWNDDGWHQRAYSGQLYPLELDEFQACCESAGLHIDEIWGNYNRDMFDVEKQGDLILVATKK